VKLTKDSLCSRELSFRLDHRTWGEKSFRGMTNENKAPKFGRNISGENISKKFSKQNNINFKD
jgi:hypothetical protein